MPTFQIIHTTAGLDLMASAQAEGAQITLAEIAVGDGNGAPVTPDEEQTGLVREMYRASINRIFKPDPELYPTMYAAEMIIPVSVGGFTVREVGVFDENGTMVVVGSLPETYKPTEGDGAFTDTTVVVEFMVSNVDGLTLVLDPSVVGATQAWVLANVTLALLAPGGTTGQVLTKASNADGDAEWRPLSDLGYIVSAIEERQTLSAGQTVVDLNDVTTEGLAVYIDGERIPMGAGTDEWDPDPVLSTRFELGQSYPDGSVLLAVQNDPNGNYPAPLEKAQNLADLPSKATARTNLGVYSKAEADQKAPPGLIGDFAMATPPVGWLKCNGAAVSRVAYSNLFSAIGTVYGGGDGVNTFNLPDFRGEFRRGWDNGRGVDPGRALGSAQADELREHTHELWGNDFDTNLFQQTAPGLFYDDAERPAQDDGSIQPTGGAETRPRNIAVLTCIKY